MLGNHSDHHRLAGVDALSDERYEPSDEVGPAVPDKGLVAIALACANRRHRCHGFPSAHQNSGTHHWPRAAPVLISEGTAYVNTSRMNNFWHIAQTAFR